MNKKVSNIQIGMLLYLITSSMFLGVSDVILLRKASNEVLISMLLGTIIGIIPLLMYLKINSTYQNLNIFEKNKKLFGHILGTLINILLITMYMVFLSMAIRAVVIFLTSKYLENTSFFLIGLLILLTSLVICYKGIITISRISQISFVACIILVIIIELFLIKYIEIDNILPFFSSKNYIKNIIDGSIYHASSCSLLSFLLLSIKKDKIKNNKKYNKTAIIFYLIASLSLTLVMFFIIGSFGYDMSTLFKYPEYILLKKIGLFNSELHLENLLAFRWIFYMIALSNISLYGIIKGVNSFKINKKITNLIIITLGILCIIGAKTSGTIPKSLNTIKYYYLPYIALPIFIIFSIIFLKCLITKKED